MAVKKKFDAINAELRGKNLIEASAGTGKTYSLALLAVRLIIENKIPVEKILMVTFTKAATAELETRIRSFVRKAYSYAAGTGIDNSGIMEIVDRAGKPTAAEELKKAVRNLDNLSVMTIHSFCEKSLMEYPFETGQSFRFEIAEETGDLRELVANEYWRTKINTLDEELFKHFKRLLSRREIGTVLAKAMEGKEYICSEINGEQVLEQIRNAIAEKDEAYSIFREHLKDNFRQIISRHTDNHHVRKFFDDFSSSVQSLMKGFIERHDKQYIQKLFPVEQGLCEDFLNKEENLRVLSDQYIFSLFKNAIDDLKEKISEIKSLRQVIDFNDQISLLHEAVLKGSVNRVLADKYNAVFIDEFQDTDKLQYEIFSRLFSDRILFYIGDPKQSIYGWRRADIDTYKAARDAVDTIHDMNLNFRSTGELISELNRFFSIQDPFYDSQIEYRNVEQGLTDLGSMTENETPVNSFEIFGFSSKDEIGTFVVNEIARLLTGENFKIKGNPVKASDITVVVRKNKEAKKLKKLFEKANIPAVTIDDTKVLSSDEATEIRYLMEAVIQPNRGAINRVLLFPATGINTGMLIMTDEEEHLEKFRELKLVWHKSGIYNMLSRFLDMYNARQICLSMGVKGQRILTNFQHIAEILHKAENRNRLTPNELLTWCQRVTEEEEDEYEQRIESEDDAVKIVTVHKCKGLTYRIVFAPYLDLKTEEHSIFDFRENGKYFFTHQPDSEQKELWRTQTEQENRRLIYVALTRAQYKVYLCVNNSKYFSSSSLKSFPIENQRVPEGYDFRKLPEPLERTDENKFSPRQKPENLEIKNPFGIHSFSSLSRAHYSAPFEKTEIADEERRYDRFIFQELGRGANVGTALHSIFERLDFGNDESWEDTILEAAKYSPGIIRIQNVGENSEGNTALFKQLVNHVMKTSLSVDGEPFSLSQVAGDKKIPELEFYFSVAKANKQVINDFLGEEARLGGEADIEGLMTGFIDLVFEHHGKYYILDWKSNHLGNDVNSYNREGLEFAMAGSNYHLQYMIYTVALKRWLESKSIDFYDSFGGVIYVFLRGVRTSSSTGLFVNKPAKESIEKLDSALKGKME